MSGEEGSHGPLAGVRVVEFAGLGAAPFAAMMLSDLGADVVRVERPAHVDVLADRADVLGRGRRSVRIDLKSAAGQGSALDLVRHADVLIEGYRPGVLERLGLGPDECLAANPRLIYGRLTGWGREGPRANDAGHDLNYLAITGALAATGERGRKPVPAMNLVADLGGGAMVLVAGVLAALVERATSGHGQVVDAAMVDGVSYLMAMIWGMHSTGTWTAERGANLLDGGAPFYDTYPCADGEYVAVAPLEPQFWAEFLAALDLSHLADLRAGPAAWPEIRSAIAARLATQPRAHWAALFTGTDACVTPVLTLAEAPHDAHLAARGALVEVGGITQPAPAPRFSRTPAVVPSSAVVTTAEDVVRSWSTRPAGA